jgi:hypothetical protein
MMMRPAPITKSLKTTGYSRKLKLGKPKKKKQKAKK